MNSQVLAGRAAVQSIRLFVAVFAGGLILVDRVIRANEKGRQ